MGQTPLDMQALPSIRDQDYPAGGLPRARIYDFFRWTIDASYASYLLALSIIDQIDEVAAILGLTFQALQALRASDRGITLTANMRESAVLKFILPSTISGGQGNGIGTLIICAASIYTASNQPVPRCRRGFPDTTHNRAESAASLVEAYLSLGLTDEAQTGRAILGHNYQSTECLRRQL